MELLQKQRLPGTGRYFLTCTFAAVVKFGQADDAEKCSKDIGFDFRSFFLLLGFVLSNALTNLNH